MSEAVLAWGNRVEASKSETSKRTGNPLIRGIRAVVLAIMVVFQLVFGPVLVLVANVVGAIIPIVLLFAFLVVVGAVINVFGLLLSGLGLI